MGKLQNVFNVILLMDSNFLVRFAVIQILDLNLMEMVGVLDVLKDVLFALHLQNV